MEATEAEAAAEETDDDEEEDAQRRRASEEAAVVAREMAREAARSMAGVVAEWAKDEVMEWLRREAREEVRAEAAREAVQCVICMERKRDVVLAPCRHALFCRQCISALMMRRGASTASSASASASLSAYVIRFFVHFKYFLTEHLGYTSSSWFSLITNLKKVGLPSLALYLPIKLIMYIAIMNILS